MSARDLINIGIFAALYTVIVYIFAMLGILGPVAMIVFLFLGIIVAGIPYMLFLTRVKHGGMVTLFGVITGGVFFLTGQPWPALVIAVLGSLVGEVLLWAGRYRSKWLAIAAYTVFSLWFIGSMLPLMLDPVGYYESLGMQQMGEEYIVGMQAVFTGPVLAIYCVGTAVSGVLGGLIGAAVLRKHFVRAGLA
jgi:energy-coupling factor transport system substrate-specific component